MRYLILAALLITSLHSPGAYAQIPRLTLDPEFALPDPDWQGDEGGASRSNDRSHLQIPYTWGLRLGYAGSGAAGTGPGTNYEHGVAAAFDYTAIDTPNLTMRARTSLAIGENGLNYFSINANLLRFRLPLEKTEGLWLSVNPLDIEARMTTSPNARGRFGYRPTVGIGTIQRIGGANRLPCDRRPVTDGQDICDQRKRGLADGACVLRVFANAGAMLGYQQTQGDEAAQFLTGAEAYMACRSIVVDLSYILLLSGQVAHRADADIFTRFPVGGFDIGPYTTAQISYENAQQAAAPSAANQWDRSFYQIELGLRVMWDGDR